MAVHVAERVVQAGGEKQRGSVAGEHPSEHPRGHREHAGDARRQQHGGAPAISAPAPTRARRSPRRTTASGLRRRAPHRSSRSIPTTPVTTATARARARAATTGGGTGGRDGERHYEPERTQRDRSPGGLVVQPAEQLAGAKGGAQHRQTDRGEPIAPDRRSSRIGVGSRPTSTSPAWNPRPTARSSARAAERHQLVEERARHGAGLATVTLEGGRARDRAVERPQRLLWAVLRRNGVRKQREHALSRASVASAATARRPGSE